MFKIERLKFKDQNRQQSLSCLSSRFSLLVLLNQLLLSWEHLHSLVSEQAFIIPWLPHISGLHGSWNMLFRIALTSKICYNCDSRSTREIQETTIRIFCDPVNVPQLPSVILENKSESVYFISVVQTRTMTPLLRCGLHL